jgi:predicted DNA-binding ribbon-helix-helix protein
VAKEYPGLVGDPIGSAVLCPAQTVSGGPKKYSLTIQGHSTSLTLEPIFWEALNKAAAADGKSLAALVAEIDEARTTNLSSAIRVWLFERARVAAQPAG